MKRELRKKVRFQVPFPVQCAHTALIYFTEDLWKTKDPKLPYETPPLWLPKTIGMKRLDAAEGQWRIEARFYFSIGLLARVRHRGTFGDSGAGKVEGIYLAWEDTTPPTLAEVLTQVARTVLKKGEVQALETPTRYLSWTVSKAILERRAKGQGDVSERDLVEAVKDADAWKASRLGHLEASVEMMRAELSTIGFAPKRQPPTW